MSDRCDATCFVGETGLFHCSKAKGHEEKEHRAKWKRHDHKGKEHRVELTWEGDDRELRPGE